MSDTSRPIPQKITIVFNSSNGKVVRATSVIILGNDAIVGPPIPAIEASINLADKSSSGYETGHTRLIRS
ncbi:hypothetical protein [Bradyrhizobium sp. MOS002]|uniref:hypothetical protein n=1 Tax=Bradyrhizobium sp. MOS002 TaxID=2133947 RepID=UPI0011B29960|nr:hypothetical protein [Bradyrhizobium sp. MOS002]